MQINKPEDWEYDFPDGCMLEDVIAAKSVDWTHYTLEFYKELSRELYYTSMHAIEWYNIDDFDEWTLEELAIEVSTWSLYEQYRFLNHTGEILWVDNL